MSRSLPVSRILSEFTIIVLGVLVALGVDAWNTDRTEAARGDGYMERLAGDIRIQIDLLNEELALVGERLAKGDSLLASAAGGAAVGDVTNATYTLFGGAYEVPLANWTYREMAGNAELSLIRDPEVRRAIVAYYANAERLEARIGESRALLRSPAYQWMGQTPVLSGYWDRAIKDRLLSELLRSPEAEGYIHSLMTYLHHRSSLWEDWVSAAEAALETLEGQ